MQVVGCVRLLDTFSMLRFLYFFNLMPENDCQWLLPYLKPYQSTCFFSFFFFCDLIELMAIKDIHMAHAILSKHFLNKITTKKESKTLINSWIGPKN